MKKLLKSNSGTAAVEFAIIAPLLFVLVFGIIEFGAMLYNQSVITNASREAARFSATFYTNPFNGTPGRPSCTDVQNYVVQYVNAYMINFKTGSVFNASNVKCPYSNDPSRYSGLVYAGYVDTIQIEYYMSIWSSGTW